MQNTTQKIKDRATRTPLKTGGKLMWSGSVNSSCSISGTRRVTLVQTRWQVMNGETIGKSLWQVEEIRDHL
jgi:hypothetical protein